MEKLPGGGGHNQTLLTTLCALRRLMPHGLGIAGPLISYVYILECYVCFWIGIPDAETCTWTARAAASFYPVRLLRWRQKPWDLISASPCSGPGTILTARLLLTKLRSVLFHPDHVLPRSYGLTDQVMQGFSLIREPTTSPTMCTGKTRSISTSKKFLS